MISSVYTTSHFNTLQHTATHCNTQVHDIIGLYDLDGDGGLDLNEFKRMIGILELSVETSVRSPGKAERMTSSRAAEGFNQGYR